MPVQNIGEKFEKLFRLLEYWFEVVFGILISLVFALLILGFWTLLNLITSLWDFIHLYQSFGITSWSYIIAFVIGSIAFRIGLIILGTYLMKKSDEGTLIKWFELSTLCTMIEWSVIGFISFLSWCVSFYCVMLDCCASPDIWIYSFHRIIIPYVSNSLVFGSYLFFKLWFEELILQHGR